jgi:hypothetical protein
MAIIATLAVITVSVWVYLHIAPAGADPVRVHQFNFRALVYLVVLCLLVVGLFFAQVKPLEFSFLASEIFCLIFVPAYLAFAGLLRSRILSAFHRGGRSTV